MAWILLCKSCKFGDKICYNDGNTNFSLRDCFLLAPPVHTTELTWKFIVHKNLPVIS